MNDHRERSHDDERSKMVRLIGDTASWKERIIGSGNIGEKAEALLWAHQTLKKSDSHWEHILTPLNALFIATDSVTEFFTNPEEIHMDIRISNDFNEKLPPKIHEKVAPLLTQFEDAPFILRRSHTQGNRFAFIIQPLFGANNGGSFFPHLSGIGMSFNPYAWHPRMNPEAGAIRLAFGLGTRISDRDDFTHLSALDAPFLHPVPPSDGIPLFSQRKVDVFNIASQNLLTVPFEEWANDMLKSPISTALQSRFDWYNRESSITGNPIIPALDHFLKNNPLLDDIREILGTLQQACGAPVEVEFSIQLDEQNQYRIALLNCKPDAVYGIKDIPAQDLIFRARQAVIGRARFLDVDRIILIPPDAYSRLNISDRHTVSRILGRIMRSSKERNETTVLIGPGRWGSTTPSLGVPCSITEIYQATAIGEITLMHEGLLPEASMGTHLFPHLVERNILYFALNPKSPDEQIAIDPLLTAPNRLNELMPDYVRFSDIIHVVDFPNDSMSTKPKLLADPMGKTVQCGFMKG